MKYKCTETTFYDRIYNPGDFFTSTPDDDVLFKDNPCWDAEPTTRKKKESGNKTE